MDFPHHPLFSASPAPPLLAFVSVLATFGAIGCASEQGSVCEEAEELAISCGVSDPGVDFGECSGDVEAAAEDIVEKGCDGFNPGKSDVWTQLCQGPLRNLFSFCKPESYRCEPTSADLDPELCNGSAELCEVPYNEVVFATSHNAFNAATMGFNRPNQSKRMYVQLRDGVRALMLDTHLSKGEVKLCHTECALGSQLLSEGLAEIRDFLECHPNEVVTLLIEPHVNPNAHLEAFAKTGLHTLAYAHTLGDAWPTLGELIAADKRLVVFSEAPGATGTPDWFHHLWDHGFDNEFAVRSTKEFDCDIKRGDSTGAIFGLNHFITFLGGDEFLSIAPNRRSSLLNHVEKCEGAFGRKPTFLSVDFHDIGSVVEVARELNQP